MLKILFGMLVTLGLFTDQSPWPDLSHWKTAEVRLSSGEWFRITTSGTIRVTSIEAACEKQVTIQYGDAEQLDIQIIWLDNDIIVERIDNWHETIPFKISVKFLGVDR